MYYSDFLTHVLLIRIEVALCMTSKTTARILEFMQWSRTLARLVILFITARTSLLGTYSDIHDYFVRGLMMIYFTYHFDKLSGSTVFDL